MMTEVDPGDFLMFGRLQPCRHCGKPIRLVHGTRGFVGIVDDSPTLTNETRILEHDCGNERFRGRAE